VARVTLAYLFFHLKGLKQDRGTANWFTTGQGWDEALVAWADRARLAGEGEVASFGEMMVRNPQYFREADPRAEFRRLFPALPLLPDPPLGWTMTRLKETFKNVVSRTGLLHALGREK
jgi:hypothetical protein